jgi:hypothetical protein
MNDTFLPPIEKPQGLMMKLAFFFTRRQFGRVLTPLMVHSARLPPAFGMFYGRVRNSTENYSYIENCSFSFVNKWPG